MFIFYIINLILFKTQLCWFFGGLGTAKGVIPLVSPWRYLTNITQTSVSKQHRWLTLTLLRPEARYRSHDWYFSHKEMNCDKNVRFNEDVCFSFSFLFFFFLFYFFFFLFKFYGPSRLFHSFSAEKIVRWGEKGRSPRKNI